MMTDDEALAALRELDELSIVDRAGRLTDIAGLLGDRPLHLHGDEARALFDDVQATWVAGYFAATVVSAHSFCSFQLASLIRLRTDLFHAEPGLRRSLEELAQLAESRNIVDASIQGLCIELAERNRDFEDDQASVRSRRYDSHTEAGLAFDSDHPLLSAARVALRVSIAIAQAAP